MSLECFKETWVIFPVAKSWQSKFFLPCCLAHSLLKKSARSATSFPGDLPTLRLRKGDSNCSVTRLQSTGKVHQPSSKRSSLNSNVITCSNQNMTLSVLHNFRISFLMQCHNYAPMLKCFQCSAAHIYVSNFSLR